MQKCQTLRDGGCNKTHLLSKSRKIVKCTVCTQEHGVELRHLTSEPFQTECTKVVYLVRAQIDLMKFICSHVHTDVSKGLQREYFVYFVPRRAVACEKVSVLYFGVCSVVAL